MPSPIQDIVSNAQAGDADALNQLARHCQDKIHRLATRMVVDPELALDATQEILIRIVTKLSTFKAESSFDTWAYRIAVNYLLTARKVLAKDPALTFSIFSEDLINGLADQQNAAPDDHVMLNELRIKCTMAMLMCLDGNHRAAYVLGEILELDHREASAILEIGPATFRKRLSRARSEVIAFTAQSCGLANKDAPCTCRRRLPRAMSLGRIGESPSDILADAPSFKTIEAQAEQTSAASIAAKLQRSTGLLGAPKDFAEEILRLVNARA